MKLVKLSLVLLLVLGCGTFIYSKSHVVDKAVVSTVEELKSFAKDKGLDTVKSVSMYLTNRGIENYIDSEGILHVTVGTMDVELSPNFLKEES